MARPHRIRPGAVIGFALVHAAALGVFAVGFSWEGVALCLVSYYVRMFAITAGFHRYFSHRTYRLGRIPQFLMAFLGQTAAQKGVLWWAAHHRRHHRFSDQPQDVHSPVQEGFWWSHMGWILSPDFEETDLEAVPDLAKFPELVWLNRNMFLATILYAVALTFAFGGAGLFYGYFLSTALLWHGTFSINSVMHVYGRRVFPTADQSRNSFLFALVTMGEGWHNNHHYYPGSAAQGFRWWQVDASYYLLWLGERLRVVRDLHRVPARLKAARPLLAQAAKQAEETLAERVEMLSSRWEEMKDAARLTAHQALRDLEAARAAASQRLETLQRDYAAALLSRSGRAAEAWNRAGNATEARLTELKVEIAKAREHLEEILTRLVEAAEGATGGVAALSR